MAQAADLDRDRLGKYGEPMNVETRRRVRGAGRIFRRENSQFIWVQYYDVHGNQIRESSGTRDERKAEKFLRKKIGEVEAGVRRDTRRMTYDNLRDSFIADYTTNRRKSLRFDSAGRPYLDKVLRLDEHFSGWRASDIDADSIRKFIASEQQKGRAAGTINRSLSALRRMFHLAKADDKLRDIPYFPMLKEAAPRSGFFERADYDALLRALPDYLHLPVSIGFFSGMRLGEILALEWSQVDLLANTINLRPGETKNDQARTVPITPELRVLLLQQRGRRQQHCQFVCFKLDRLGNAERLRSFRKAWYSACVTAGLGNFVPKLDRDGKAVLMNRPQRPKGKPKPIMIYEGRLFHDLRRSGVCNLVRAGVPERIAQAISGHKSRSVFERYNIVSPADILEAGRKLAAFHSSQKVGDISGTVSTEIGQSEQPIN